MKKYVTATVLSLAMMLSTPGFAGQINVPLQIDYGLIEKALNTQLYKDEGHSAKLWNDRQGCSFLKFFNPQVSGQNGQVRLLNEVQARLGTGFGGQCVTMLDWDGILETFQQPTLNAEQSVVTFPITRANAYDREGRQLAIDKLQDLIRRVAEPKLAAVKVDLNESRVEIQQTLARFLPRQNAAQFQGMLDTLKFSHIQAQDNGINVNLAFNAPAQMAAVKQAPAQALNEAEQQQWAAAWQQWDEFLTAAIKQASDDTQSQELRDTLMEILLDSRAAFQAGLKGQDSSGADPVRVFFTETWVRLAPVLKTIAREVPGMQGMQYLTFIAATDVMYELENLGAPFGLEISADGLRRLARMLIAGRQERMESKPMR
jgi:hypothetical protein